MAKTETKDLEFYNGRVKVAFYPNSHRYKLTELDGEKKNDWIPSPSTIIGKLDKSPQLVAWAVRCFEEKLIELMRDGVQFTKDDLLSMIEEGKRAHTVIKESACNVGTVVHDFAEAYSADPNTPIPEDYNALTDEEKRKADHGMKAFKQWVAEHNPHFIKTEFSVFSIKEMFVGTSDVLVELGGKKYLLDYKTSNDVYSSHFYQASAYLKAYEEEYGEKLAGAMIIHISKDDVFYKGELKMQAGDFGVATLSRSDLVQGYKAFKALQTIYSVDKEISKKLYERK